MSFKTCPKCGTPWRSCADLLRDPRVRLLGYQPGPLSFERGFFLFNHAVCGTSLALELPSLESLVQIPILALSTCSRGEVPDACLREDADQVCPLFCVCSFVQAVRRVIEVWPKAQVSA
jgi:hypothetical protein